MRAASLRDRLGHDLFMLAGMVPSPLTEATPLQGAGYPGYAASSFRLDYQDGRTLKGRRFVSAPRAAAVHCLTQRVAALGFPTVIGRMGAAVLTEWVDGRGLEATACGAATLRTCARLQARLHSTAPVERGGHDEAEDDAPARLVRSLEALEDAGLIGFDERRVLLDRALHDAPPEYRSGIIHRDYCAENLVVTPSGEVRPVDNETLAIGACDYDLGRTWYRWPMTPADRATYLEAYETGLSSSSFVRGFAFWYVAAVSDAALFRSRRDPRGAAIPLLALRRFLGRLTAGVAGVDLVLTCDGSGA